MIRTLCIVMVLAGWIAAAGAAETALEWKPFTPIEEPPPLDTGYFKGFRDFTPMTTMEGGGGGMADGAAANDPRTVQPNTSWKPFKPFPPKGKMQLSPQEWRSFKGFRPMERLGPHPIKKYRNQ